MKKSILLSIVVPTHNSEKTIGYLFDSINQSSFNKFYEIEVIVVNDCSQDDTATKIRKLIPLLKYRTTLISLKKNVGPAKARNLGVKAARGKYLVFLDGDVQLKKKTLNNIYQLLKKNQVKAFTGIWDYHQNSKAYFPSFKALRDWCYWFVEKEEGYRYYLFSTRIAGIERKLFLKLGGFNESYKQPTVEDIEFTYKIERQVPIKFCPNIIVSHEFENFVPIAVKYFKRTRDWVKLFMIRRQFDPVATSRKEAVKPFLVLFLIISIILALITSIQFFGYLVGLTFLIYIFVDHKFLLLLYQKKGLIFTIVSLPVSIILYLVILLGAVYGYIEVLNSYKSSLLGQKSVVGKIK